MFLSYIKVVIHCISLTCVGEICEIFEDALSLNNMVL